MTAQTSYERPPDISSTKPKNELLRIVWHLRRPVNVTPDQIEGVIDSIFPDSGVLKVITTDTRHDSCNVTWNAPGISHPKLPRWPKWQGRQVKSPDKVLKYWPLYEVWKYCVGCDLVDMASTGLINIQDAEFQTHWFTVCYYAFDSMPLLDDFLHTYELGQMLNRASK
jgi:hypothetical protein